MATEATRFKVGLFLIVGFLLATGVLIWLGASRFLVEQHTYVTYFSESVQGLDVGSPVKYQGVPVGNVTAVRIAPDGRLVEVEMGIDPDFRLLPGMRAKLSPVGITGAVFVDIGFPRKGETAPPPRLPFEPPEDYIPSTPSFLGNLAVSLSALVAQLTEADLPGLTAEVRALVGDLRTAVRGTDLRGAVEQVARAARRAQDVADRALGWLRDSRLDASLTRLARAAKHAEDAAAGVSKLARDPALAGIVADLGAAARDLRQTAGELRAEALGLNLPARLDAGQARMDEALARVEARLDRVASRMERALTAVERSAREALGRVEGAGARAERLVESLEEAPSRALLETPPPEDLP